mmetsp:Transcript_82117/g.227745  ORF Transcript_82117/g.227745 Transcript_82117/m.227745 type:complete len:227 (+) Transcript_82117:3-683(+)
MPGFRDLSAIAGWFAPAGPDDASSDESDADSGLPAGDPSAVSQADWHGVDEEALRHVLRSWLNASGLRTDGPAPWASASQATEVLTEYSDVPPATRGRPQLAEDAGTTASSQPSAPAPPAAAEVPGQAAFPQLAAAEPTTAPAYLLGPVRPAGPAPANGRRTQPRVSREVREWLDPYQQQLFQRCGLRAFSASALASRAGLPGALAERRRAGRRGTAPQYYGGADA